MRVEAIFAITQVKWNYKRLFDERFFIFKLNIQNAVENVVIESDI